MLDRLEFLLAEALVSLRRNTLMTFAAVTTSAMALFLIGGIGLIYLALANTAASMESKFEMRVHMKDLPSEEEKQNLQAALENLEGVGQVTFKDKDQVWAEFQENNPKIVADVGEDMENPLPDTFVLTLDNLSQTDNLANEILTLPGVAEKNGVNYLGEEQALLERAMFALRWIGFVLGGLTLATGGILIYNTIRLTMESRRKEIRIMELVGATKNMVVTPLLIEGATQGFLGAGIASAVLAVAYVATAGLVNDLNPLQETAPFPARSVILILGLIGVVFGLLCSYIAIREPKQKEMTR